MFAGKDLFRRRDHKHLELHDNSRKATEVVYGIFPFAQTPAFNYHCKKLEAVCPSKP
jgi:hypothetical protein